MSPVAPAPMEGQGAYNRNSRVQAAGLGPAIDWFRDAAAAVTLDPGAAPIVIADYGASEGHNSLAPIAAAIQALRPRIRPDRAIVVMHTDLPDNDFSALFGAIDTDPASYLAPQVYPAAVGRSFYGQILPGASVSLGWSSWAVQWLSRIPGPIPDQLAIAFSRDPGARAAYAAQAAADWSVFLAARAAELRLGARLVVLTMAIDAAGDFGYAPLVEAMYAALQDCVRSGVVSADEAARMAIPTVGRSRADLMAPLADGPLALEALDVFTAEDSGWAEYQADGDAAAWAARWAGFSRASVFPTLAAAIEDPARRAPFMDRMMAGLAAGIADAPQRMNIPLARLSLVRTA